MNGIERIAAERKRQVDDEEWDAEHDSQHTDESLALAACHYAFPDKRYEASFLNLWPDEWHPNYDKKGFSTRIRDLEKAGALIAAEIDRLIANQTLKTDGKEAIDYATALDSRMAMGGSEDEF